MKNIRGFKNGFKNGFSNTALTIALVAVAFIAVIAIVIITNVSGIHYDKYNFNDVIAGSADNGFIVDHVKGNPDAPVKIVEYADFQCPLCAAVNPKLADAIDQSDGQLAIIYRNFPNTGYHANAKAAAIAAEAAGLQGYWQPYADLLFKNQADWEYATATARANYFKQYFEEVTGEYGDLERFEHDLTNSDIDKKINFDVGIAYRIDIPGTPALYVDGNLIDWTNEDGAEIVVNNRLITWDSAITLDGLTGLLLKITEAELEE